MTEEPREVGESGDELPPIKRDEFGRILPGQRSLNPTGRPKQKPFTEALNRVLEKLGEEGLEGKLLEYLTLDTGNNQALAAFKYLWDRREGPMVQKTEAEVRDLRTLVVLEDADQAEPPMPPGLTSAQEGDDGEDSEDAE